MMNHSIFIAALLLAAPVFAAEQPDWKTYHDGNPVMQYDAASITPNQIVQRYVFTEGLILTTVSAYNCANKTTWPIHIVGTRAVDGVQVSETKQPGSVYLFDTHPDTASGKLYRILCGR